MDFTIQPLTLHESDRVRSLMIDHWVAPEIVAHDHIYQPHTLPGFVAVQHDAWIGLVTYHIDGTGCEIVTLDSLQAEIGVGTALINAVVDHARQHGCTRVWLITTNDNLHALGFYQKRGFVLVAVHRNAVDRSRMIKPSIPLIGNYGIPIRDEIELEMML